MPIKWQTTPTSKIRLGKTIITNTTTIIGRTINKRTISSIFCSLRKPQTFGILANHPTFLCPYRCFHQCFPQRFRKCPKKHFRKCLRTARLIIARYLKGATTISISIIFQFLISSSVPTVSPTITLAQMKSPRDRELPKSLLKLVTMQTYSIPLALFHQSTIVQA